VARASVWFVRSLLASSAPIATFASRFARNIILSRLLVSNQFGTAIAIGVVLSLIEQTLDVGLDRFVMVNSSKQALAAAHVVLIARGFLVSFLLAASSPLMAAIFGVLQFSSSFALVALVPLIDGFTHIGIKRIKKDYKYGPDGVATVVSSLAGVGAVTLSAIALRDHRAIVIGLVTQSLIYVALTHLLAHAPYWLRPDRASLKAALSFGAPLTFNGIALATISQLDRVMVGHWFGVSVLGIYAVILNLAVAPVSLIVSMSQALGLSYLLSSKKDSSVELEGYQLLAFAYSTLALLYALFVALTLDIMTPYVFGSRFSVSPGLHLLITVMVFLRLQRGGAPTIALLATGQTRELALLNLPAGIGLLIAVALTSLWPRVESVVLGVVFGDFISLALFLVASSPARAASQSGAAINYAVSFLALAIIIGTLLLRPEITLSARGTVLFAGLLGIGMQLVVVLVNRRDVIKARGHRSFAHQNQEPAD
jgi:O-antigen/teichoic acid export membrane protein